MKENKAIIIIQQTENGPVEHLIYGSEIKIVENEMLNEESEESEQEI